MSRISHLLTLSAFLGLMCATAASADPARNVTCVGCVGSSDILDGGVKQKDIAADAVTAGKIRNGAVNANKLASGAVDWQKLAVELRERILQLEDRLAAVEARSADTQDYLSENTVLKLDGYLDLDTSDPEKPTARFAGVNLQVVNGTGETMAVNGLGNVIVGYDDLFPEGYEDEYSICSDGIWHSRDVCLANGGVWALNHKSGSHNLAIGPGHRYSQAAGFVVGRYNAVNGESASVSGGSDNVASGLASNVSGGSINTASGTLSAISGGGGNTATNTWSVVSGGGANTASGRTSVVSGGQRNTAQGGATVVSGGDSNTTSGGASVVSGGYENSAERSLSVVSGGRGNITTGEVSVVSGGLNNTATYLYSVVSGGEGNSSRFWATVVSGGHNREAFGDHDWVAGELRQDQ